MTQSKNENDGLDELRRSLAQFVLREAGLAVAADPTLPLSSALVEAVREEARRAAEHYHRSMPTSEELADRVQDAVAPRLVQIAQAAAEGKTHSLDRSEEPTGLMSSGPVLIAIGLAVAVLLLAAGYGAGWWVHRDGSDPARSPAAAAPTPANEGNAVAAVPTAQTTIPSPVVPPTTPADSASRPPL